MNKIEIVKRELNALGQYWRNDWSDFDGRTLRDQLDTIASFLDNKETDLTEFSDLLKEQAGE
jgi:hypothetical protein